MKVMKKRSLYEGDEEEGSHDGHDGVMKKKAAMIPWPLQAAKEREFHTMAITKAQWAIMKEQEAIMKVKRDKACRDLQNEERVASWEQLAKLFWSES